MPAFRNGTSSVAWLVAKMNGLLMLQGKVLWGGRPGRHSVASGNPHWAFQVAWILKYPTCPVCSHCSQNTVSYSENRSQIRGQRAVIRANAVSHDC